MLASSVPSARGMFGNSRPAVPRPTVHRNSLRSGDLIMGLWLIEQTAFWPSVIPVAPAISYSSHSAIRQTGNGCRMRLRAVGGAGGQQGRHVGVSAPSAGWRSGGSYVEISQPRGGERKPGPFACCPVNGAPSRRPRADGIRSGRPAPSESWNAVGAAQVRANISVMSNCAWPTR